MKNTSITIGIPAYNEENNLKVLMNDISAQKLKNAKIDKVIVYSDGSTDNTPKLKDSFRLRLKIIHDSTRRGQAYGQNMIIKATKSDILILLNADIRIKDKNLIEKLIFPITGSKIDLVSCRIQPIKPKNYFEKILLTRVILKQHIFENWKGGNNIYT